MEGGDYSGDNVKGLIQVDCSRISERSIFRRTVTSAIIKATSENRDSRYDRFRKVSEGKRDRLVGYQFTDGRGRYPMQTARVKVSFILAGNSG